MSAMLETLYPELVGRQFSPAEVHRLSGISAANQRLWRSRGISPADVRAPYSWEHVMQFAVVDDATAIDRDLAEAWQVAQHEAVQRLYWHDFRRGGDQAPLFVFVMIRDSGMHVATGGGAVGFDTASPYWARRGWWVDFSAIQRLVLARYELMRAR